MPQVRVIGPRLATYGRIGDRQVGLGAAGLGLADKSVHRLPVARTVGDALVVPVAGVVGGVRLPVVGVGRVAAFPVDGQVQVGELRGGGEGAP